MARASHSSPKTFRIAMAALSAGLLLTMGGCALIGAGVMTALTLAPLKLMFACLPEGTQIDLPGGESKAIESLRSGDLVIGFKGEPVKILQIHGYLEDAENTEFYAVSFSNGSTVDLCSMHRIGGIRAKELAVGSVLPNGLSVVETRTYGGVERSYDLLTEDSGYQIGGVPVNSMIEEMYQTGQNGKVKD